MRGFQNVGNFTCVTLQIKEEKLENNKFMF